MSTAPKPQPVSADPVQVGSKHYTTVPRTDHSHMVVFRVSDGFK